MLTAMVVLVALLAALVAAQRSPEMTYALYASNKAYCDWCFSGNETVKFVLCETQCGQMSVTHVRLTCTLTCGGNKLIGTEDAYDCSLLSPTVLFNTPCDALTSTAPTTAGSTTAAAADDGSNTVIIIIVVVVVAVVLAVFITVAAVMFRRGKQVAPVSNVSVVVENKTTERPAKTKSSSSSKSSKVAMGIPDDAGYPSEAGGTASLNYPEEASSVPNVDYAHSGAPSEAGYGKSGAQGYPPQIGDSSDDSSGPPA